uniref:BESS domain-containing protein n=1 Tax=Parascaris univalens TaxID=6257 RepID=A0A915AVR9_PARUN
MLSKRSSMEIVVILSYIIELSSGRALQSIEKLPTSDIKESYQSDSMQPEKRTQENINDKAIGAEIFSHGNNTFALFDRIRSKKIHEAKISETTPVESTTITSTESEKSLNKPTDEDVDDELLNLIDVEEVKFSLPIRTKIQTFRLKALKDAIIKTAQQQRLSYSQGSTAAE